MKALLFWVLFHVPLGRLGPWVFGLALGRQPHRVSPNHEMQHESEEEDDT